MRVPQRKFVVEYKSRSRTTKADKPASIWGDTDLKAVALQVEEHAPHLFDVDERKLAAAHDVRSAVERKVPSKHPADCPSAPVGTEFGSSLASGSAMTTDTIIESMQDSPVHLSELASSKERLPREPDKKKQKGGRAGRLDHTAMSGIERNRDAALFDLDELEAENSRLKALLRDRLISENARLKQMLARFS